jgi:hypothetical protein
MTLTKPPVMLAVLAAMVGLVLVPQAQADPIEGSEAIAVTGTITTSPTPLDIQAATSFMLPNLLRTSGLDDYASDSTTTIPGPFTLMTALGSSLTISNAGWGTFTGVVVFDSDATAGVENRAFILDGSFTPGPNQKPGTTANTASLDIGFTQSGGPGNVISGSLTLHTPSAVPGPAEPTSLLLSVFGLAGLYVYRRFRR